MPRSGYTLPVFACAAAIAALRTLLDSQPPTQVEVDLIEPAETVAIAIDQAAPLSATSALAICRSDPGDNLDLTRDTPVWAKVELDPVGQTEAMTIPITIQGGEGIGKRDAGAGPEAIYAYARQLLLTNLEKYRPAHQTLRVTIILPEGRALAERTSNAAFGVVEGLSLLGTSGISHPLSAPDQLETFRDQLRVKAQEYKHLVFCIGENGLALAPSLGFPPDRLVKTANWLGPLLVEAGMQGVEGIILLGYHGKLIKLAGGIFHTHHHIADGRQEILTAIAAHQGLPTPLLQKLYESPTIEAGLDLLRSQDPPAQLPNPPTLYTTIAQRIDQRATTYIHTHCGDTGHPPTQVGSILFDRHRQIIVTSQNAVNLRRKII